jgi:Flp pilus assembly pilin Flp
MNYEHFLIHAIDQRQLENRNRTFAHLERVVGSFPKAIYRHENTGSLATEFGLIAGIIAIVVFVLLPKVTGVMNEYASSSNCLMQIFEQPNINLNSKLRYIRYQW